MRFGVFAILLGAAPVAFGQSSPAAPFNPDNLGRFSSPWTAQSRDFGKLPQQWSSLHTMPFGKMHLPPPKPTSKLGDAAIDPRIVVHPMERNLGTQPGGTLVAQNLYPGLRLLPVDCDREKAGAPSLTTRWPNLKIEEIPIVWPALRITAAKGNPPTVVNPSHK